MVATKRASTDLGSQQNATNVIENLVKAIKVPRATQGSSRQTNPASGSEHAEVVVVTFLNLFKIHFEFGSL